jgi:4-hydroxy-2-oxoheptanedioate aldolase
VKNRLKELLDAGEVVFGAQLRFGSPAVAELFGLAGFDYLVVDGEHAPQTPTGIQSQLQGIGCTDATPIVRLYKNDPDLIRLYLDMGAMGIIVPLICTAAEARLGAEACRYPPQGTRGCGPARAAAYGFDPDYLAEANDRVLFLPLIETAGAIENIEEILAVDGVDSFIVGPVDLAISLGIPSDFEHPIFLDAINKVTNAARDAGKPAGMGVYRDVLNPATYRDLIDQGFRLLVIGGDEWMLKRMCGMVLKSYSEGRS